VLPSISRSRGDADLRQAGETARVRQARQQRAAGPGAAGPARSSRRGPVGFGALSERISRKPSILAGCLPVGLSHLPLFGALTVAANPALAQAQQLCSTAT
jgi:hypothetical protein